MRMRAVAVMTVAHMTVPVIMPRAMATLLARGVGRVL
jgi:hypothetical protein